MIPQSLLGDPCEVAERWRIHPVLADKLHRVAEQVERVGLGVLMIISGYRTIEEQRELELQGRPTADPSRSTHTTCPATGADVWLASAAESNGVRFTLHTIAESYGLRVGGGGPEGPDGMPVDWNHFDLGPRG